MIQRVGGLFGFKSKCYLKVNLSLYVINFNSTLEYGTDNNNNKLFVLSVYMNEKRNE